MAASVRPESVRAVLIDSSESDGEGTTPGDVGTQLALRSPQLEQSSLCVHEAPRSRLVKRADPSELCLRKGVHTEAAEDALLTWAVVRPVECKRKDSKTVHTPSRRSGSLHCLRPVACRPCPSSGERVQKRLRTLKHRSPGTALTERKERSLSSGLGEVLRESATSQLGMILGTASGPAAITDGTLLGTSLAAAITDAFIGEYGATASKPRLMSLLKALRGNELLRNTVLEQGVDGVAALARQDPQEWASADLQLRRQQWTRESLKAACPTGGQVSICPECGGRAIVECGQSADFKKAKQYAHYTCMEEKCGKITHIKE